MRGHRRAPEPAPHSLDPPSPWLGTSSEPSSCPWPMAKCPRWGCWGCPASPSLEHLGLGLPSIPIPGPSGAALRPLWWWRRRTGRIGISTVGVSGIKGFFEPKVGDGCWEERGGGARGSLPALFCFWEDAGAGGEGLSLERDIQVLGLLLGRIWGSWPPLGSRLVELQVMLVVPPLFLQGGKGESSQEAPCLAPSGSFQRGSSSWHPQHGHPRPHAGPAVRLGCRGRAGGTRGCLSTASASQIPAGRPSPGRRGWLEEPGLQAVPPEGSRISACPRAEMRPAFI